jgi:pseudaminic acid biosynthesis-associated methylase
MDREFKTEQEAFWAGQFGDAYIVRNTGDHLVANNISLFARIFSRCRRLDSLIEFGANVGLNLRAIRALSPETQLDAIEINDNAVMQLRAWGGVNTIHRGSILDFHAARKWDAVLMKGVLIHVNPDYLQQVYEAMFRASDHYLIVVEYYNPTPVEVSYRGHMGRLFKRDFAGELLDKYPTLRIVDYGFVWHRDPMFPQDDVTWFVLEKGGSCA